MEMSMPPIPLVPLPLVVFGFLIGIMFGVMIGRKRQMMMQSGGWHGEKPWMHHGMRGHHHHGEGGPACMKMHGNWPTPEDMAPEEIDEQ
jgi:hypothetical protein